MFLRTFIGGSRIIGALTLSATLIACSPEENQSLTTNDLQPIETDTKKTVNSEFGQLSVQLDSAASQLSVDSTEEEIEKLSNVRSALIKVQNIKSDSADLYRTIIVDGKVLNKTKVAKLTKDEKIEFVDTFRLNDSNMNYVVYEILSENKIVSSVNFEALPDFVVKGRMTLPSSGIIKASTIIFQAESSLVTNGADARLLANHLIGQYQSRIVTIDEASILLNRNNNGMSGGQIQVLVNSATGSLQVDMRGENGKTPGKNIFPMSTVPPKASNGVDAIVRCEAIDDFTRSIHRRRSMSCACIRPAIPAENGRDGYQGHRGLDGGHGGDAGTLVFHIKAKTDIELRISSSPGRGANGGEGGDGGEPGAPGDEPKNHSECPAVDPAKLGSKGKQGDIGSPGNNGKEAKTCLILPDSLNSECRIN